jgi:hypothetical protein
LCRKASHPEATLLEKPYLNAPIKSISWAQPLMPHMWAKWFWMLHQHPPASTSNYPQMSSGESAEPCSDLGPNEFVRHIKRLLLEVTKFEEVT